MTDPTPIPPIALKLGQKILEATVLGVQTNEFSYEDGAAVLATALGFYCKEHPALLAYAFEHAMTAARGDYDHPEDGEETKT